MGEFCRVSSAVSTVLLFISLILVFKHSHHQALVILPVVPMLSGSGLTVIRRPSAKRKKIKLMAKEEAA